MALKDAAQVVLKVAQPGSCETVAYPRVKVLHGCVWIEKQVICQVICRIDLLRVKSISIDGAVTFLRISLW